jgi:signal peptidase II
MKLDRRFYYILFPASFAFFLVDFFIKQWAVRSLHVPRIVFETPFGIDFLLQKLTNRGAAWGMFSSYHDILLGFRVGVIGALLGYIIFLCRSRWIAVASMLIMTGAAGNVFDCYYYGHVIDMFHFLFWGNSYGVFNFADMLIFFGALGLSSSLFMKEKEKKKEKKKVKAKTGVKRAKKLR